MDKQDTGGAHGCCGLHCNRLNILQKYYLSTRSLGGSQAATSQVHLSSTQVQLRQVPSSGLFTNCRFRPPQTVIEQHQPRFISSAFLKREEKVIYSFKAELM
jgi:hypothetical protein